MNKNDWSARPLLFTETAKLLGYRYCGLIIIVIIIIIIVMHTSQAPVCRGEQIL